MVSCGAWHPKKKNPSSGGKMLKILNPCFSGGMLKQTITCFGVVLLNFLSIANPYLIETAASHCWSIAMGRTGTSAEGACHPLRRGAKAPDGIHVRLMPVTEFGQGIGAPSVLELERRQPVLHWLNYVWETSLWCFQICTSWVIPYQDKEPCLPCCLEPIDWSASCRSCGFQPFAGAPKNLASWKLKLQSSKPWLVCRWSPPGRSPIFVVTFCVFWFLWMVTWFDNESDCYQVCLRTLGLNSASCISTAQKKDDEGWTAEVLTEVSDKFNGR